MLNSHFLSFQIILLILNQRAAPTRDDEDVVRKVIREKSRGEGSLIGQDTIENGLSCYSMYTNTGI